jgi:hypothetical protein
VEAIGVQTLGATGRDAAAEHKAAVEAARLIDLAHETTDYARAWAQLAAGEASLAKYNLVRMLIVALLVPAMAAGVVVGLDASAVALLQTLLHSWSISTGIVAVLNIVLLLGMLWQLRSWLKSLSLPKSRAALSRLWASP